MLSIDSIGKPSSDIAPSPRSNVKRMLVDIYTYKVSYYLDFFRWVTWLINYANCVSHSFQLQLLGKESVLHLLPAHPLDIRSMIMIQCQATRFINYVSQGFQLWFLDKEFALYLLLAYPLDICSKVVIFMGFGPIINRLNRRATYFGFKSCHLVRVGSFRHLEDQFHRFIKTYRARE